MSDLIDRQAALDAVESIIKRDTSGNNDVVNAMIAWREVIKGIPSANRWIPCSERLPEENAHVLVQTLLEDIMIMCFERYYDSYGDTWAYWKTFEEAINYETEEVIAWMPLPAPYKR